MLPHKYVICQSPLLCLSSHSTHLLKCAYTAAACTSRTRKITWEHSLHTHTHTHNTQTHKNTQWDKQEASVPMAEAQSVFVKCDPSPERQHFSDFWVLFSEIEVEDGGDRNRGRKRMWGFWGRGVIRRWRLLFWDAVHHWMLRMQASESSLFPVFHPHISTWLHCILLTASPPPSSLPPPQLMPTDGTLEPACSLSMTLSLFSSLPHHQLYPTLLTVDRGNWGNGALEG